MGAPRSRMRCVCLFPTIDLSEENVSARMDLDLQALNILEDQGLPGTEARCLEGTWVQHFVHTVAFACFHPRQNHYKCF